MAFPVASRSDTSEPTGGVDCCWSLRSACNTKFVVTREALLYAYQFGCLLMEVSDQPGDLCALCQLPPNCPSNRKKLKKLFGDSFSSECLILQAILIKRNASISFQSNDVVCIFCQRALSKIHRLDEEMKHAISEVDVKLEKLCQACMARLT